MRNLYVIDILLIVFSLAILMFLVGYARPLVIAPLDEYESSGDILFSIEKADYLLIDDNAEFTTPDRYDIVDGLKLDLEPGQYYWKAGGILGSEVRTLTIKSVVNLELVEKEGVFGVVNTGNERLNVDVYNNGELVEKKKLNVGGYIDGGNEYIGGIE